MASPKSIGRSFLPNPKPTDLRSNYEHLRRAAISLNRSRGQILRQVRERDLQIEQLKAELQAFSKDAALDYQEKAQLLQILGRYRDVFAAMELAGDELVEGLTDYDFGARPYSGGAPFGRLIKAVRAFVSAWKLAKDMGPELKKLESGV